MEEDIPGEVKVLGYYLNCTAPAINYEGETKKPYFVDKTPFLAELIPLVENQKSYICVTRPRRFGKSIAAAMIASYFGKGKDTSDIFESMKIASNVNYKKHLNQYDLIYIDFSKYDDDCTDYQDYISNIKEVLREDLHEAYPNVRFRLRGGVSEDLTRIFEATGTQFIFVFDEWDTIFHKKFVTSADQKSYIDFLAILLKDQAYVKFAYMTGILPIAKYTESSTLNNFDEYNMANSAVFNEYFGFTEAEVDELYKRYLTRCNEPIITREDLAGWYDGYHTDGGESIYNPRSVVTALTRNELGNYWTKTGRYSEIAEYIINDTAGVRNDVTLMAAGESVPIVMQEYAATAMRLNTKDEIFSAMVVYGFLNYNNGYVRIPNRELLDEFEITIHKDPGYQYMQRLEKESEKLLQATLDCDTQTIAEVLEFVHNSESPLKNYNNEAELSGCVKLAYIAARNKYNIVREDQAGKGYVDYIFYPYDHKADGIILELKVNHSADEALQQIKDRKYAQKFKGKIGEEPKTTGRILAVGIAYQKKTKIHECKIEIL